MPRKKKAETPQEIAVSEQTTVAAQPKPVRITCATEKDAKAVTAALRADFQKFTAQWWEMGQRVKDALDRQVPSALGMNAHDWMMSVFGESASVAKITRSLRIARALNGLPEEKVKMLTEGKAYLLTQLKEKDREAYLGAAITVTNSEFEQIVENCRQSYGIAPSEERVHIAVTVDKSVAEQWEECERKVARLNEWDIELKPGLRAQVFEAIAALINNTPDEVLLAETTGGEEAA